LLYYLPGLDFCYYIYINTLGLLATFTKTTQWK